MNTFNIHWRCFFPSTLLFIVVVASKKYLIFLMCAEKNVKPTGLENSGVRSVPSNYDKACISTKLNRIASYTGSENDIIIWHPSADEQKLREPIPRWRAREISIRWKMKNLSWLSHTKRLLLEEYTFRQHSAVTSGYIYAFINSHVHLLTMVK